MSSLRRFSALIFAVITTIGAAVGAITQSAQIEALVFSPDVRPYHDVALIGASIVAAVAVAAWFVLPRHLFTGGDKIDLGKRTVALTWLAENSSTTWNDARVDRGLDDLIRIGWSVDLEPQDLDSESLRRIRSISIRERTIDHLSVLFEAVSSQRLILLGDRGAGKSSAAILFLVDQLNLRPKDTPDAAVPVIFRLSSWSPRMKLVDWMEHRLLDEFRGLATEAAHGSGAARALLESHRILPIFDGLDEVIDGPAGALAVHRAAFVSRLAAASSRFPHWLLTSRAEAFHDAEAFFKARTDVSSRDTPYEWPLDAAVVVLAPASPEDADKHLPGLTKVHKEKWAEVQGSLRIPSSPLATVFASPHMVSLARKVYQGPSRQPRELLELTSPRAIEARIIDGVIPAAFPQHLDHEAPGERHWDPESARAWLAFLAAQMRGQRELRWWDLTTFGRRATVAIVGLLAAVIAGFAVGLSVLALFNLTAALMFGGMATFAFGLLAVVTPPPKPSELQIADHGRLKRIAVTGVPIGLLVGVVGSVIRDPTFGAIAGLAFGLAIGLLYLLTSPVASDRPLSPTFLLRQDVRVGVTYGTAYGALATLVAWTVSGSVIQGIATGVAVAAAGGLLYGPFWVLALGRKTDTGERRSIGAVAFLHLGVATLCLAWRGKVPWRFMAFLRDAHKGGVFRQVGGEYFFAHELLQETLAREGGYRSPPTDAEGQGDPNHGQAACQPTAGPQR